MAVASRAWLSGASITCISSLDWNAHWTSKQNLMALLARDNDVVYVEPVRTIRHLGELTRLRRGSDYGAVRRPQRLRTVRPFLPLPGNDLSASVRSANAAVLTRIVPRSCDVLWFFTPRGYEIADRVRARRVIYQCVDFHSRVPTDRGDRLLEQERALISRADIVFATAPPLLEHCRRLGARRTVLTPHGVDHGNYATERPVPLDWPFPDRPVAIVSGTFDGRLDVKLVADLARARPDVGFLLVGKDSGAVDFEPLRQFANVAIVGPRSVAELAGYMQAASVGLVPYRVDSWTEGIFPLKLLEYLAAGLPVIATPLPSLIGHPFVTCVPDAEAAARALEGVLAAGSAGAAAERSAYAREHTWEAVLERMAAEIHL